MNFMFPIFVALAAFSVAQGRYHHGNPLATFFKDSARKTHKNELAKKNDALCDFCKETVGFVWNKEVLDQLVNQIDIVCNYIVETKIREACHAFVKEFVKATVDSLLKEYTVEQICVGMQMCTSSNIFFRYAKLSDSTARCEGCKLGVSMVDAMFKSEEVTNNLKNIINDHICILIPQKKECNEAVNVYTVAVMGILADQLSTDKLCVKTAICTN